jgi:small-conductance mechanosensitive channel
MELSVFFENNKDVLYYVVLILGTFLVAALLSSLLRKLMGVFIDKYAEKLRTDPTNFKFLKNSVPFVIYTSAIIFIFTKIPFLNSLGTALFAGAGILAVIVGFASQQAFSNIISGIFILIFKPFKIADIIEFKDGTRGAVEEITLRHTMIRNFENRRIIMPNSIISDETIINSSILEKKICNHIVFSISYDSDMDQAMEIMRQEIEQHPLLIDNRTEIEKQDNVPLVRTRVIGLTDFSIDIRAWAWTADNADGFVLRCDVLKSVKERFDKEGVEIPFPYRTIVYKKDIQEQKKID